MSTLARTPIINIEGFIAGIDLDAARHVHIILSALVAQREGVHQTTDLATLRNIFKEALVFGRCAVSRAMFADIRDLQALLAAMALIEPDHSKVPSYAMLSYLACAIAQGSAQIVRVTE